MKVEFEYGKKLKTKCFFLEISVYQDADARGKKTNFLVGNSSSGAVFLIEILMEEIEMVVAEI